MLISIWKANEIKKQPEIKDIKRCVGFFLNLRTEYSSKINRKISKSDRGTSNKDNATPYSDVISLKFLE